MDGLRKGKTGRVCLF